MTDSCTWAARSRRHRTRNPQFADLSERVEVTTRLLAPLERYLRATLFCVCPKGTGILSARSSKQRADGSDDGVFGRWHTSKAHSQLSARPASPSARHLLTSLRRPCGGLSRAKSGLAIIFRKNQFFYSVVQKENLSKRNRRPPISKFNFIVKFGRALRHCREREGSLVMHPVIKPTANSVAGILRALTQ
jgi:hypothetical protein